MIHTYRTLSSPAYAELKSKGSRFLAFAYPINKVEDIKPLLEPLQKEHFKAVHFCYAYRIGTDGSCFRANDDGEPSGSAGRPILGQIDSFELTNCLVIIVRYFGGTLLGVSGLIHAYKSASMEVLTQADKIEKDIQRIISLQCEYPHLSEALRIAKQHNAQILQQNLQLNCHLTFSIPLTQVEACKTAWEHTRLFTLSSELTDIE